MKYLLTTSLPAMIFCGSVVLVYYLSVRLWLGWLIAKLRRKPGTSILKKRSAIVLHVLSGIGIICIGYAYFIEPYWPQINEVAIKTNKLKSTAFRIVQFSDIHCDKKVRFEKRLPEIINSLKPDVIVFTGDALNTESALRLFQETLSQLEAPLGKYAVTGNWDDQYWSNLDLFAGTGFEQLNMEKAAIVKESESIIIAGISHEDGPNSFRIINQLNDTNFNVLLFHTTSLVDFLGETPVDLYLSGHTHGGQVALPFYGALMTLSEHGKQYESGLYQKGHIQIYVNRGIGLEGGWSPKVRFWARPEITVFDIRPK